MKFERIIEGKDHLWAVRDMDKEVNELTGLFRKWNDLEYLFDFFRANRSDLEQNFHIHSLKMAIDDTLEDAEALEALILDMPYTEELDNLFVPLGEADRVMAELSREKARNWDRTHHASWLRVYAIRLEPNVYIVTGGAIKLTRTMQDRAHTQLELDKLNQCRQFLMAEGVFDKDSFTSLMEEEYEI